MLAPTQADGGNVSAILAALIFTENGSTPMPVRDARVEQLAALFNELKGKIDELRDDREESERRLVSRITEEGRRMETRMEVVSDRMGAMDVRFSREIAQLTVKAGMWGAIGGAIAIAVPLGMAVLLWMVGVK